MLVPKVGAGYSGMMFALSPVFTLAFAAGCGFQTPSRKGLLGIVLGLSGAGLITLGRQTEAASPALPYLLASAAIPALLAAGNVYRSIDWPQPTKPLQAEQLAFWSHGFAAVIYLLLLVIQGDFTSLPAQSHTPVFLQLLVAGATAPVVFRLQHYGGPVLLSQLGYIAAAVSLVCVNLWLGERYSLVTWAGAGVIALGIALSVSQPSAAQPLKTRKGTV
jgi:drug/metabolite transporter (DMT)-like permease